MTVYGITGDGGHAHFMRVPASTLVPLPEALSFEEGAAISCGTGTAYTALSRIDVSGRDTLAVFGQGPVGLSATMLGRAMGARVIAVDVSAERLELAERFGAEAIINSSETDPVAAIHDLTNGEGATTTMDFTGVRRRAWPPYGALAHGAASHWSAKAEQPPSTSASAVASSLTIHASWTFSVTGQAECARFMWTGKCRSRIL
jgi:D-arabinose 1-dehydrogenase-like Zn-dependent alcohol dehydrogenase